MMQKHGLRANAAPHAAEMKCECCGTVPTWSWSDLNGEAYCLRCGVPHQVANAQPPRQNGECNWKPKAVEWAKEYCAETGKPVGGGTFLGFGEYPEVHEAWLAFTAWLQERHPEAFEAQPRY